uniref:Late endosomal/lysosomal adaptor and MAPK and MTOR activator 5 n=1 Tax=Parastrongyloides trichosuri TaxID=131310 RepID=A0A0N5A4B8_PARTI
MMLLAEDIERLIEKTNILKSLSGMCLSVNNNPGLLEFEKITAVMVVKEDSNKKITPIAFGATQKVSSTQVN